MTSDKPIVYLLERGILGWASIRGDWKNWPNQAVAWLHGYAVKNNLDWRAQSLSYFTTPFTAGVTRYFRAKQFCRLLEAYKGWKIIIVAHSEGTATVIEALRLNRWPRIEALHLLCGACDSNFARNGLNFALRTDRIGRVVCYRADNDWAMKIEDTLLGLALFGISWNDLPLGLSGPVNVADGLWQSRLFEEHWAGYGHSDCFEAKNFEATMEQITGHYCG